MTLKIFFIEKKFRSYQKAKKVRKDRNNILAMKASKTKQQQRET